MSGHDDLINETRDFVEFQLQNDPHDPAISVLKGLLAALEARPSLAVRGEEELAKGIDPRGFDPQEADDPRVAQQMWPDDPDAQDFYVATRAERFVRWREEALSEARRLIANGTVQVVPSLVAASREALIETIKQFAGSLGAEWSEELADALLAGPVQMADATPEQAWDEAHCWFCPMGYFCSAHRNPYDGFTRKETGS